MSDGDHATRNGDGSAQPLVAPMERMILEEAPVKYEMLDIEYQVVDIRWPEHKAFVDALRVLVEPVMPAVTEEELLELADLALVDGNADMDDAETGQGPDCHSPALQG